MEQMTETDKNKPYPQYQSYLLRVWAEDPQSELPWRIALINPQTGGRRGFADFERLVDFLRGELPGESDVTPKEVCQRP